jgi:enediyne polyketide synthase
LQGRRCFRQIPSERLDLADYAGGAHDADRIGMVEAGLIEGYRFERERFRVPLAAYQRTDMAHWLALDVATRALADLDMAGIDAERERTAVIVANTLTGEFSRAHAMRYRWPYVERVVRAATRASLPEVDPAMLISAVEAAYKAPFPPPDEDSLAGALANTIAGRIANHHDLRGGAYTVDGACASSLVAVVSAFEKMALGDVSCAVVGAVDLSLDPFELVGFARNGALAPTLMRVFDRDANGFWPGEGCGFMVLANEAAVTRHSWPVLAWIDGAAMSTDGAGALTRPTAAGQALAARRAWARAGRDPAQADYFEAHGTGTPTGDPIELAGLAALLAPHQPERPIPVGSIKANIGHTKAAAGMAGLLKAIAVARHRILPATTGCHHPHPILAAEAGRGLAVLASAEPVTHRRPLSVGVNSFGFGGINCHVVLAGPAITPGFRHMALPVVEPELFQGELFQLAAPDAAQLLAALWLLERRAASLSRAELAGLAQSMSTAAGQGWRASLVAGAPGELARRAAEACQSLQAAGTVTRVLGSRFSWSAPAAALPRIALLFPGQGSVAERVPHLWAQRFGTTRDAAVQAAGLLQQDTQDTSVLQPLLAETAIGGLDLLAGVGLAGQVVCGHSFGELPALYAGGRLSRDGLRRLAARRGACLRDHAPAGAMLAVRGARDKVDAIAARHALELACDNGGQRYVLAGAIVQVDAAAAECAELGLPASRLPAGRAFHSRHMEHAREVFAAATAGMRWPASRCAIVSSITGDILSDDAAVSELLGLQLTGVVRFAQALDSLGEPDLVLEVGAGAVLAGLAEERYAGRVLSMDIFGASPLDALAALGAAWVCGAPLRTAALYDGRQLDNCRLETEPVFFANACGVQRSPSAGMPALSPAVPAADSSALAAVFAAVVELTGLQTSSLTPGLRLLTDLHLNSIRARHAVALAAQRLGISGMPFDLTRFADASLEEAARHLDGLCRPQGAEDGSVPDGLAPWLRFYSHAWQDAGPAAGAALPPALLDDTLCRLPPACRASLAQAGPDAARCLVLALPAIPDAAVAAALLSAVQHVLTTPGLRGLLVLQAGQFANGFLRSVAAESPEHRWCAVEYDICDLQALAVAGAEYADARCGYAELRWRGQRCQRRVWALAAVAPAHAWPLQPGAVLLVSGGARGIGAASAAVLARQYGCRLALVGRSAADNEDVVRTLAALSSDGHHALYFQADLAVAAQAHLAVAQIQAAMGPVRALLHAAGVNQPLGIRSLGAAALDATLAAKAQSLAALLDCLPAGQLQLVIGYGSLIGEAGLAGAAHYALANEWMAWRLRQLAQAEPGCRVLCLAWTAWRETGMAARLDGVLDSLRQAGTRALDTGEATAALMRAIHAGAAMPLIISGRYGRRLAPAEDLPRLQKHRYLERPLLFYPGVELIAEAVLCSDTDRYLRDHAPFDVQVLPLVCAIEAMLSAAQCLQATDPLPAMDGLRVGEALTCRTGQRVVIRTYALRLPDGSVRTELRAASSGYGLAHFSATFHWDRPLPQVPALAADGEESWPATELLYRGLCFHGPRFQCLGTVTQMRFSQCQGRTVPVAADDWYGPWLAAAFAGGAPAVRDAALHLLQLCVPHQVVLPVSVAEVRLGLLDPSAAYRISARQCHGDGVRFVFDIEISTMSGAIVECWRGLELLRARACPAASSRAIAPAMLEPLIGRLLHDELHAAAQVGVVAGPPRQTATALATARAIDAPLSAAPLYRSVTHADDITVAVVSASQRLAVDLQFAPTYSLDEWRLMLGEPRLRFAGQLADECGMAPAMAMLYTWTLSECLVKLDILDWPLDAAYRTRVDSALDGAVLKFACAGLSLLALALAFDGRPARAALALAVAAPGAGSRTAGAVQRSAEGAL